MNIITQDLCAKNKDCGWFNHSQKGCYLKTARVNYDDQIVWMIVTRMSSITPQIKLV